MIFYLTKNLPPSAEVSSVHVIEYYFEADNKYVEVTSTPSYIM